MKALIYKDLIAVWRYCRNYLFICGGFLVLSIFVEEYAFLQIYPLILMGTLINTLIAYDERDGWDLQVLTMPVSRKQYVTAKYLTGLVLQGTTLALTAAVYGLGNWMNGTFDWEVFWRDVGLMVLLAAAAPSLILPFVFRNGSEKGRMAYLIVFGTIFALFVAGSAILVKLGLANIMVELPVAAMAAVLTLILYPCSWALSVYWYEKREL